jgi:5-methylcytosine-specific restriction endonuclease McrA
MAYDPEYFKKNRPKFAHYAAEFRDKLKAEMVQAYGGKCQHCGVDDPIVLCLDHVNDDAHVEKEEFGVGARGGHKQYSRLKAEGWPQERFQLLCYNCNAVKEHNRRRGVMLEKNGPKVAATAFSRSLAHAAVGLRGHNKSGIKGVFWNKQKQRWHAKAMVNQQTHNLGLFKDMADAAEAYKQFAIKTWGEHANYATPEEIAAAIKMNEAPEPVASDLNVEDLF